MSWSRERTRKVFAIGIVTSQMGAEEQCHVLNIFFIKSKYSPLNKL
jgi:hypothetical protein